MRMFWKKAIKSSQRRRIRPRTPIALRLLLFFFVGDVSRVKRTLFTSKNNKINKQQILLLLFPRFCAYFSLQTLQFLWWGRKSIFTPEHKVPNSYANVLRYLKAHKLNYSPSVLGNSESTALL